MSIPKKKHLNHNSVENAKRKFHLMKLKKQGKISNEAKRKGGEK